MSAFSIALKTLFGDKNLAKTVTYIAAGEDPVEVRAMLRQPDELDDYGDSSLWSESTTIDVFDDGVIAPRPDDEFTIGDEIFRVHGEPVRDDEQLIWTVNLEPA